MENSEQVLPVQRVRAGDMIRCGACGQRLMQDQMRCPVCKAEQTEDIADEVSNDVRPKILFGPGSEKAMGHEDEIVKMIEAELKERGIPMDSVQEISVQQLSESDIKRLRQIAMIGTIVHFVKAIVFGVIVGVLLYLILK